MSSRDGKRGLIAGTTGSGKSYFAQHMTKHHDRLVIVDPKHSEGWREYAAVNNIYRATSLKDLRDVLADNDGGSFRILYCPPSGERGRKELDTICDLLFFLQEPYLRKKAHDKVTLLVDELHKLDPNDQSQQYPRWEDVNTMGRESGIDVIAITQRPQKVSLTFRELIDWTCAFKVRGTKAARTVQEICDDREDVYNKMLEIPMRHHVYYSEGEMRVFDPIKS